MKRHHFLKSLAVIAAACAAPLAWAQAFPTKTIKVVTPFPAGQGPDVLLRMVADKMGASLGQATVIENKPGAAGEIAASFVAGGFARWCNPADGQQQHHGGRAAGVKKTRYDPSPTSALWAASCCSTPSSWRTSRSASAAWRTVTITSALWSEDGLLPLLTGLLQSPEHSRGSRPSWFALRKR